MLVITRKPTQAIRIGDIRMVVTRVSGGQVRLGFKTPPGVRVYREEIYENIRDGNISARLDVPPNLSRAMRSHEQSND